MFVLVVGVVANEFSRGTIRTAALTEPNRVGLLAGKILALLASAAAMIGVTEILTWVAARSIAPSQGVGTGQWNSFAALGNGVVDFGAALFWVTGYALFGVAIAVVFRSVPIALAVAVGWAGPFEHLVGDAWNRAGEVFPGLLLESFISGGSPDVGMTRAVLTIGAYGVIAVAAAASLLVHRDIP